MRLTCSTAVLVLSLLAGGVCHSPVAAAEGKQIVAYVFVKDRVLGPNEVLAKELTRVNYAFSNIVGGRMVYGFAHDRENLAVLTHLRKDNPRFQVLVSVGGWTWSGQFSDMALTPASRRTFIDSVVEFVRDNQLDGLDIDWEYPGLVGNGNVHRPEDKQNYTSLLRELRLRFDQEQKQLGRPLVISVAAGASAEFVANTEMAQVARYVDSVNLMSYDYYEPDSDAVTGHHAPLYTNPADPKHVSADDSVKQFEAAGVPTGKIVLGLPFYGHTWADVGETNHGLFQPGKKTNAWATYHDVVDTLLKNGYVRYWDETASAPYLYNSATRTFVSYEDVESVERKCTYVIKHELSGIMFWSYDGDSADHALLNSIDRSLGKLSSRRRP